MSEAVSQTAAQHRKLGLLVLGIGAGLLVLFVSFAVVTSQPLLLIATVLIVPNIVVGVRELRAARAAGTTKPIPDN